MNQIPKIGDIIYLRKIQSKNVDVDNYYKRFLYNEPYMIVGLESFFNYKNNSIIRETRFSIILKERFNEVFMDYDRSIQEYEKGLKNPKTPITIGKFTMPNFNYKPGARCISRYGDFIPEWQIALLNPSKEEVDEWLLLNNI